MKSLVCRLSCLLMSLSCGLIANQTHGDLPKGIASSNAANGERAFSCSLINTSPQNTNFAYSPYSLYVVLSMLRDGARDSTADEISKVMNIASSETSLPSNFNQIQREIERQLIGKDTFSQANALWLGINATLLPSFQKMITNNYKATIQPIDFSDTKQAAQTINDWAKEKTEGKISDFIQPQDIQPYTRMIITNATYLKAQWLNPFDQKLTSNSSFFPSQKAPVNVPMMNNKDWFYYFEDETVQCVAMPFRSPETIKSLDFYIILPKSSTQLNSLQTALNTEQLQKWMNETKLELVQLSIPKFTLCYEANVNKQLQNLGMQTAYSPSANFSGIDGTRTLKLDEVVQQVIVEVDESGVIAAATTRGSLGLKSVRESLPPKIFKANRPFLFFIADDVTRTVLFTGRLETPQVQPCE